MEFKFVSIPRPRSGLKLSLSRASKDKILQLPQGAGVYAFVAEKDFFYIGKASNLRERVQSHFQNKTFRDNLFIDKVKKIGWISTSSEIEALVLEAQLIKNYKPKYNILWRDDKNFFFVAVTKENFPRVFLTHQTGFKNQKVKFKTNFIGPFVDGRALKATLKILRKVFPYYSSKKHPKKLCSWCHLGLCPGPNPNKKEYRKNIKNLMAVLRGKNKSVLKSLKKEMKETAFSQNYERAAKIRDQIIALEKILAHARIFEPQPEILIPWDNLQAILQKILKTQKQIKRIEAYDVSNIQGQKATGSMITFIEGIPAKNFYRKFKIKAEGRANDVGMIKEVLTRRLRHNEWPFPDLILIDGGKSQLKAVQAIVRKEKLTIPVMALAKRKNELFIEKGKNPILLKSLPREIFNLVLQLRDEAHRFAIEYHRKLRRSILLK